MLVACLRSTDPIAPPPELLQVTSGDARLRLVLESVRHRVDGVLYAQVKGLDWPDEDGARRLRDHHVGTVARHLQLTSELQAITTLLNSASIPSLALKGPVLAECTYPRPDLRSYGDIDLLIHPQDVRRALDVLHESGAHLHAEPWAELRRTERAQLALTTRRGISLDLHWHAFNNPGVRRAFPTPTYELFERRRQVMLLGRAVRGLGTADELVFLATHAAQSGGALLVWILDLHFAAKRVTDWDDVVTTAQRRQSGLVTAVMLARARHLLATPLPDGLLEALSTDRSWRALLHTLDRYRPPQRHEVGTGRLLLTSTRGTTRGSLRKLGGSIWSEAVIPFALNKDHPWRRALSHSGGPAVPAVPGRHLDSSKARDRFLDWVEAGSEQPG